ncbi:hypothetical protein [Wenzhouxiangella sediminis]|jgi:hypothetical protein|uniref:Uncharacterized protein n=1 Tax=Wenzhouxiangella sediminis TaxID=1792836 RepID=A0A3E1KAM1_9GAMM|nr:hypothetical protein [Wenzhouxiangella sediminis]RFF30834.1 hypothetical protein DZC52_06555 [Wenzhouxiangella sediminis]
MSVWLNWILLLVFAVHLAAFAVLGLRRRQLYYLALVVTFGLLTASFALRLWGGGPVLAERALYEWLRYGAWAAAVTSVSWTVLRARRRIQAGRQNCS